jgi:hypothetical protein
MGAEPVGEVLLASGAFVQTFEWEGIPGHVSVETATFDDLGLPAARSNSAERADIRRAAEQEKRCDKGNGPGGTTFEHLGVVDARQAARVRVHPARLTRMACR